ncbi:MAG: MFS transporter [Candidatus Hodarchaeales archaeon]|jgi:MFS family permease
MSYEKNENENGKLFSSAMIQRNIRIFQITGFDITVLAVPVIILVWLKAGLVFHEMLLLQGLFILPTLILEVPSGSIADYWSRKACTVLYNMLFCICMFLYAIGNDFTAFAIAEMLGGVAIAFNTGSDTALIYDSLLCLKKDAEKKFGAIISQRMTIMFVGGAIGALIGGFISFVFIIRLPLLIAALGHLIFAFVVFWGYTEPPRLKSKTPRAAMQKAFRLLKKSEISAIVGFSLTGLVFSRIAFWAVQDILVEEFLVNTLELAFILAGFNVCAALSSMFIRSNVNLLSKFTVFLVIILVEGSYIWVLIQSPEIISILTMSLLTQITRGIRTPIIQTLLQQYLSSDVRATFNSIISFVGSFVYFFLSVFFSIFNSSRNQSLLISFFGLLLLAIIFIVFLLYKKGKLLSVILSKNPEVHDIQ